MDAVVGWISSAILVVTLFVQVRKQWHDDTSKGVSPWLFIGQLMASSGFLLYSIQIENWVFVVTNVLTALAAVGGLWITRAHQTRRSRNTAPPSKRSATRLKLLPTVIAATARKQ